MLPMITFSDDTSTYLYVEGEATQSAANTMLYRNAVARNTRLVLLSNVYGRRRISSQDSLLDLLHQVQNGSIKPLEASHRIRALSNDDVLSSFARLDYDRASRVGFPEAVFAENKTVDQVGAILDSMARDAAEKVSNHPGRSPPAILATRVDPDMFDGLQQLTFNHGDIEYHSMARIVTIKPHNVEIKLPPLSRRCVVVTAGTTDSTLQSGNEMKPITSHTVVVPVAEEAAVTLELSGCQVDRVYDAGVAGLHRILRALPVLTEESVGSVIVAAGMDGALPSVVGGLVSVPVIAVPTSVGYGASFGGISAMLTMMNSCSPGVGVCNIDNGFGAAALAFKCMRNAS